jgi:hypothetical protein
VKSATISRFGAGARNCRLTRSGARSAVGSATVVRTLATRRTPSQPLIFISRSIVQRATWMPSRFRWAHIFNDPYSDSGRRRPCWSGS